MIAVAADAAWARAFTTAAPAEPRNPPAAAKVEIISVMYPSMLARSSVELLAWDAVLASAVSISASIAVTSPKVVSAVANLFLAL